MLNFGGGQKTFLGGFTAETKNSANPDIRRRLGRLIQRDSIGLSAAISIQNTAKQLHP